MTVANILTLSRLVLVPVFALTFLYDHPVAALFVFCLAAGTDLIDGSVARWLGQQSAFGAALDPVADKCLLGTTFIFLVRGGAIPLWFAGLVVGRDLLLMLTIVVMRFAGISVTYQPTNISKAATLWQIATASYGLAVFCVGRGFLIPVSGFVHPLVLKGLVAVTGILTAITVAQYLKRGLKTVKGNG